MRRWEVDQSNRSGRRGRGTDRRDVGVVGYCDDPGPPDDQRIACESCQRKLSLGFRRSSVEVRQWAASGMCGSYARQSAWRGRSARRAKAALTSRAKAGG